MTDFDKLIKEKAEQAEYTYKPSTWRQFQRKSGMRVSAPRNWLVGLSSALVVGGVVAFFGYRHSHNQPETENSNIVVSIDTTCCQTDIEIENTTTEIYQASEMDVEVTNNRQVQGKHQSESVVDSATKSTPKKTITHVAKTPRYGRPLVIDVDTIKENVPTDEELRNGNSRLY